MNEVIEHYSLCGYSLLSRKLDTVNLVHDTFYHCLILRSKGDKVTVQAQITTSDLLISPITTLEFTYPNPNIERAITQLLEIRRMARL